MNTFVRSIVAFVFVAALFLLAPGSSVYAFYTGMPASVVIGQSSFTNGSTYGGGSVSAFGYNEPYGVAYDPDSGKLIVAERTGNRVLIYNSIPTTSNAPADVVIGQQNFTSTSANQGGGATANTLSLPYSVMVYKGKLFVADGLNNRVLIYNTIPTTNNAPADVVIGQTNFTNNSTNQGGGSVCATNTLRTPTNIMAYENKLFINDGSNARVLIYNSIPTTNNAAADVVIGQSSMSGCSVNQGGTANANTLAGQDGAMMVMNGKLIIADQVNNRVLIYNSIPTSNNASANIVLGQVNFTTTTSTGLNGSNNLRRPLGLATDGTRLFVSTNFSARVVVFNKLPTQSVTPHDISIGQVDLNNNVGSITQTGMANPANILFVKNKLIVTAAAFQHRVLIYDDFAQVPGLSLDNSVEGREGSVFRMKGSASVDSPYKLKTVEFSLNGGDFKPVVPVDGSFDNRTNENFYFDFDPTLSPQKDAQGNLIDGFTLRLRSYNNNANVNDGLFYFSPFTADSPSDNSVITTSPSFQFSVNRQRTVLRDSLQKYQVQVRKGGANSSASWEVLVDSIPVDFRSHKGDLENLQKSTWDSLDTDNGSYETSNFVAKYSNDSSTISVTPKVVLSGEYQWKVVAVDKAGHTQDTPALQIIVSSAASPVVTAGFPLALLHISGLGNPNISSYNLAGIKKLYRTSSSAPTFYGIVWSGATVNLLFDEQNCQSSCQHTYTAVGNGLSRFGVNIPKGDLRAGKKYNVSASVSLEDKFTQLPVFSLQIGQAQ